MKLKQNDKYGKSPNAEEVISEDEGEEQQAARRSGVSPTE